MVRAENNATNFHREEPPICIIICYEANLRLKKILQAIFTKDKKVTYHLKIKIEFFEESCLFTK